MPELSPTLTIGVIAASGFLLCNWCVLIKYRVARDTGQRLYLTTALCGAVLYLLASLIFQVQEWLWIVVLQLEPIYIVDISLESFLAQVSLPLAVLITVGANLSLRLKLWVFSREWERDDLDAVCFEASENAKPVSVMLDNRKVYIGYIFDSLEPGKDANLTILPLYSGYRDKDDLEMHLTRKYTSVIGLLAKLTEDSEDSEDSEDLECKIREYRVVIPRSRIVSINISVISMHRDVEDTAKSF